MESRNGFAPCSAARTSSLAAMARISVASASVRSAATRISLGATGITPGRGAAAPVAAVSATTAAPVAAAPATTVSRGNRGPVRNMASRCAVAVPGHGSNRPVTTTARRPARRHTRRHTRSARPVSGGRIIREPIEEEVEQTNRTRPLSIKPADRFHHHMHVVYGHVRSNG